VLDRRVEKQRKALAIPEGASAECVAWRQTKHCDAHGERDVESDKACNENILDGHSGYCECRHDLVSGEYGIGEDLALVVRPGAELRSSSTDALATMVAGNGCEHEVLTCAEKCLEDWTELKEQVGGMLSGASDTEFSEDKKARLKMAFQAATEAHAAAEKSHLDKTSESTVGDSSSGNTGHHEWNHYQVLGLGSDFSGEELKRAYRRKSLELHPDKQGGSDEGFQRVALAHQVLSDAQKRLDWEEGLDMKRFRNQGEPHEPVSPKTEILKEFFPERFDFNPFGDDFVKERDDQIKIINQRLQDGTTRGDRDPDEESWIANQRFEDDEEGGFDADDSNNDSDAYYPDSDDTYPPDFEHSQPSGSGFSPDGESDWDDDHNDDHNDDHEGSHEEDDSGHSTSPGHDEV